MRPVPSACNNGFDSSMIARSAVLVLRCAVLCCASHIGHALPSVVNCAVLLSIGHKNDSSD